MTPLLAAEEESARLDALIARLENSDECELLREHLETAHAYLLGGMTEECIHNLEMAEHAAGSISVHSKRDEFKQEIAALLEKLKPPAAPRRPPRLAAPLSGATPPPTAEGLEQFFHGTGETLGIFYPRRHVVGVYPSFEAAFYGLEVLREAGFHSWEALAVPGEEVVKFLQHVRENHALWSALIIELSRVLDTEAGLVDAYERRAKRGAGFLIAYSPDQADAEEISGLLQKSFPVSLHWFMPGYIRQLI